MDHWICLNNQEFQVLLSAFEIKDLLVFGNPDEEVSGGQEAYNVGVYSLYSNKRIFATENGVEIDPELKDIFNDIKNSKMSFHIMPSDERVPEYLIYMPDSDGCVVAKPGFQSGDYIQIKRIAKDKILSFMIEAGLVPKSCRNTGVDDVQTIEKNDINAIKENKAFSMVMEGYSSGSSKPLFSLALLSGIINDYLIMQDGSDAERYLYSEERLYTFLTEGVEKKNDIS